MNVLLFILPERKLSQVTNLFFSRNREMGCFVDEANTRDVRANEVYGRFNPTLALSRSHQVHWKVRLTRSFPSLFSRAFISRLPLPARYRSAYRALSLLDASMHIRTHLKPPSPLPSFSLTLLRRFVKLGGNARLQPAAGSSAWSDRDGVTDFDRDHEAWPDFNVLTPLANLKSFLIVSHPRIFVIT